MERVFSGFVKTKELEWGDVYNLSWRSDELIEQIKKYSKHTDKGDYFNIDLMPSKAGGKYMQINTYGIETPVKDTEEVPFVQPGQGADDDLPF